MKTCSRCFETKSFAFFSLEKRSKDGHQSRCRECVSAYDRARHAANPERKRKAARAWLAANPERRRSSRTLHQARRVGADHEAVAAYAAILRSDPCAYCGEPTEHVDHIVPLSCGGDHAPSNLTAACAACNHAKNAGSLLSWLLRKNAA